MKAATESHEFSEKERLREAPSSPRTISSSRHPVGVIASIVLLLTCAYWIALFYGTHASIPQGTLPGDTDKYVHFVAFSILGVLLLTRRALRAPLNWSIVLFYWCVLAGYGAVDEWTQAFVGRQTDFYDWCADVSGAAFGIGVVTSIAWCIRLIRSSRIVRSSVSPASSS